MTKRFISLLALIAVVTLTSCKKDNGIQCWQCYDALGNQTHRACGANEQEAYETSGTINGGTSLDNFRRWCQKEN